MSKSHAYGCILGAFVGDAVGAPLEFTGQGVDPDQLRSAMNMEGGGPLGTAPGQFTDDSEMALSLMRGIGDSPPSGPFPTDAVARTYKEWYISHPIDVGHTCRVACVLSHDRDPGVSMARVAAEHSLRSKANGALMRCMPIAVWCHRLPDAQIAAHAIADCKLTHPNESCQHANAAYCIAAAHLISSCGDCAGAFSRAERYCELHANDEVCGWMRDALLPGGLPPCDHQIGFVRWAFTYAFKCLRAGWSYEKSLHMVLERKGDTDTNAAICGGLVGAWRGVPDHMREALLRGMPRNPRPEWLCNSHVPQAFERLWRAALS